MPFEVTAQGEHHRRELVRLIQEHHREHGYAPSWRDLAEALGLTPATVQHHLQTLWRQGLVRWDHRVARSLRVVEPGE